MTYLARLGLAWITGDYEDTYLSTKHNSLSKPFTVTLTENGTDFNLRIKMR
jgi:hypothetical protein